MQNRLFDFYDEIEAVEEKIVELQARIANIKEEKISGENIYLFLHYYGTMYKEFTDAEKKKFFNTFIESIEIFKEEQPNGQILKSINFKFPVFYDGEDNISKICWDSDTTVETVILLSRKIPDDVIHVDINFDELDITSVESKATHKEIKDYVLKNFGLTVTNLNIAQVKRKLGIIERENYNLPKSDKSKQPNCTAEKEKAIRTALEYFGMV